VADAKIPEQPPWGHLIQEHRTQQGRSIRHVALLAHVSDAYWGQVERGYQQSKTGVRVIKPSRAKLVEMAEVLRLTTKQANQILKAAGYPELAGGDGKAGHNDYVDLTGLGRQDVRLLAAIADRLRRTGEDQQASPPLRAVASGRQGDAAKARSEAQNKAAKVRREQDET
jgi:transcriptional regulator with XRE-family HTH domain